MFVYLPPSLRTYTAKAYIYIYIYATCLVGVFSELRPLLSQRLRPDGELLHAGIGGGKPTGDGGAALLESGNATVQPLQAVPQALEALLEARAQVVVLACCLFGDCGFWAVEGAVAVVVVVGKGVC